MSIRVLVCGGRRFGDAHKVDCALSALHESDGPIDTIIQGGASGADALARLIAKTAGWKIETYNADWPRYGRKAGPIRNQLMIDEAYPDVVVAFPGGSGTADTVRRARVAGIAVVEIK